MFEFGESEKENFNAVIKNKLSVYETISYKKVAQKNHRSIFSGRMFIFSIVKNLKLKK